ncbi:LacI family DNA-binding transcriptional regulator [Paenarthrobacter sp. NPDC089989]|uniref:LacI family DNA-binding transcriptional regulator n=1 Tax=unclassified Paenarthrobacter TaxID=2634190 RepID=UPI0037F30A57
MEAKDRNPVRIKDVAATAGVSVATVSNVLNKPHLVQEHTRELVALTMSKMGYQPNAHAVALRRDAQRKMPSEQPTIETAVPQTVASAEPDSHPNGREGQWEDLQVGDRVEVLRAGRRECEAVIDAIMPDSSALWVWRLDGMGRQLLLRDERQCLRFQY